MSKKYTLTEDELFEVIKIASSHIRIKIDNKMYTVERERIYEEKDVNIHETIYTPLELNEQESMKYHFVDIILNQIGKR